MKKCLNLFTAVLLVLCMMFLFACSNMNSADKDIYPNGGLPIDDGGGMSVGEKAEVAGDFGDGDSYTPSGEIAGDSPSGTSSENGDIAQDGTNKIKPGTLTAGAYNDNLYFEDWLKLFAIDYSIADTDKYSQAHMRGKFYQFLNQNGNVFNLNSQNRVKVKVANGEQTIEGAVVTATNNGVCEYTAITDASGYAYLFPQSKSGNITVAVGDVSNSFEYDSENNDLTVQLQTETSKSQLIQLMFVIDATGSMSDEIDFLKKELGNVIERVVDTYNDITVQLSFLFYRDDGDSEKFAFTDFTDVTNTEQYQTMQNVLSKQKAEGGGDYPEALDEALQMAVNKQWSDGATKLIFNLLDAPCHTTQKNQDAYSSAVYTAAEKGIRISPILASGADTLTEYLSRSAAILTGGTFVFITDDSGVGNPHLDPQLPNVVIERLNDLLVRLINGYYTGTFASPVYWKDAAYNNK